jgi:hypothetical protein
VYSPYSTKGGRIRREREGVGYADEHTLGGLPPSPSGTLNVILPLSGKKKREWFFETSEVHLVEAVGGVHLHSRKYVRVEA